MKNQIVNRTTHHFDSQSDYLIVREKKVIYSMIPFLVPRWPMHFTETDPHTRMPKEAMNTYTTNPEEPLFPSENGAA